MNILIYFGEQLSPSNGGTERVACLLANHFVEKGDNIYHLACRPVNSANAVETEFLPDKREAPTPNNIRAVNSIIKKYAIDVILNEGGFGEVSRLFSHEHIPDNVKIISHLHFDPLRGRKGYFQGLFLPLSFDRQGVRNLFAWIKSPYHRISLIRQIKARFCYMLENSDAVVVLCPKHQQILKNIVNTGHLHKIVSLINPLTFTSPSIKNAEKCNEMIYVGRLEYTQKRVDRVLKTWNIISHNNPDWHLTIIGDGEDRGRLEKLSRDLGLERVTFAGRINPQSFYEKAKILLLTSNHEGTPMVVQEAMSYGVVPIVMGSFSAASDMITSGHDGIITKPFRIRTFAKGVESVVRDMGYWHSLSTNAVASIKSFSNDDIFKQWDALISKLTDK